MAKRHTLVQKSRAISSAQKAEWHELEGAGKSRVTREFFGLNKEDEAAIIARVEAHLNRELKD